MSEQCRRFLLISAALVCDCAASVAVAQPVDFDTQIIPVLTRYGCNSGACHGAAAGRGGFRLSLYGSNPVTDYERIAFELEGRRVNPARPEESLLFLKATETLTHGGGTRFDREYKAAELMLRWVREGAQRTAGHRLVSFRVAASSHLLKHPGDSASLTATAEFDDGQTVDVTRWCALAAEDKSAVSIESDGTITVHRSGRHVILARYLDRVIPVELIVPLKLNSKLKSPQPERDSKTRPSTQAASAISSLSIDDFIDARLELSGLPASPPASDDAFLRRARLRLTGRLPQPVEVRAFVASSSLEKRQSLIDRLLATDDFTEYWTHRLSVLLRIRTSPQDDTAARIYHQWLRAQVASGVSLSDVARQLITATGDTHSVGPANFYRTVAGPREQAEFVSELLMGVRLRCANCHDHTLDRWTQDDYHGLAAIFARVQTGRIIDLSSTGEVSHPRTGEAAVPRIPGTRFIQTATGVDPRIEIADWLTSPDNQYFPRAIVNRLWQAVIGRGLVEPLDDLSETNLPTHPELLRSLASDFVKNGCDLRRTLRTICLSDAFARSSAPVSGNEADHEFLSHAIRTPLEPEVLADAIADVTGIAEPYDTEPPGTRAIGLFAGNVNSESLDVLGRCGRESSCESGGTTEPGLPKALHLINGPLINNRLSNPDGRLSRQLDDGSSNAALVE